MLTHRLTHLREESCSWPLMVARQGEVSHTIGYLPPSLALTRAFSSSAPLSAATVLKPRELNIIPQHELLRPCACRNTCQIPAC